MTAQTICPIRGNPIDTDVFVIYQGQKTYFCCPGCDKDFEKDPANYPSRIK